MKKVISLLLAIATLSFATSAMAAVGTNNLSGYRNYSAVTLADTSSTATMPGFRPGDTVEFEVTGANVGDDITLVTYVLDEELTDATVQYINQYTADSNGKATVTYKVREGLPSGIYQIDIKAGSQATKTVYYKIGDVAAKMIAESNINNSDQITGAQALNKSAGPVKIENNGGKYTIGFLGKVTVSSADVSLAEIGAKPGFTITGNGKTKSYNFREGINATRTPGETLAQDAVAAADIEIDGEYSFVYAMTIYNISNESVANGFTATALTDAP
ncbi:MAG: hypothetical protein IKR46_01850 [Clostridia bacterium]|nr:hypothetical protein [Clostridia bacterium]